MTSQELPEAAGALRNEDQIWLALSAGCFDCRHWGHASAVKVDVTSEASVEAMAARTRERFGGINVLVDNAGI